MTTCLRRASLAAALALASGAGALLAQPAVHLETGGKEWVTARTPIELVVVSPPTAEDGRLAFLLVSPDGSSAVDATDLFRATERGFVYRPELAPLPPGERDLAVYLVTPAGQWGEFTRVRLKVLRAGGFETATATPRLDVTAEGRITGSGTQTSLSPTFTRDKLNLQLDVQGAFVRDGWTLAPRVNIIGASLQNEAIRFGQLGNAAPQVDLSQYAIGLTHGGFSLQVGTVIYGTERHLLFGFLSRGVQVRAALGGGVDVSFAAMNGSPIVGWDNPTGLQQDENRIFAGTLGVELLPNRPGGLRIEALYVDGSQKPISGFNQGAIVDAQKSQGAGLHLLASTASNRIRVDAGWSVSRFENPSDPFLSQGNTLVPVDPERRQAHYVDLFLDLLQRQTKAGLPMNVSLILRHSRVDPQYRTVGSFFQADREEDGAEANLFLGSVGAHAIYTLAEDNLDHIPSILTTKTRRGAVNVAAPLAQLFASAGVPRAWLPTASYTIDRTHQFGTAVPENGEFTPSFVPDQVSTTQTAALDWFLARARRHPLRPVLPGQPPARKRGGGFHRQHVRGDCRRQPGAGPRRRARRDPGGVREPRVRAADQDHALRHESHLEPVARDRNVRPGVAVGQRPESPRARARALERGRSDRMAFRTATQPSRLGREAVPALPAAVDRPAQLSSGAGAEAARLANQRRPESEPFLEGRER